MPRPKILLVDDDPDLLRALRLRLRANNYEVTTASDGYAAIAAAQKERPALIILDLGLPVGDGFVVLDRLQNSDALAGIPVIVLSARDPQNNEEKGFEGRGCGIFPETRRQRRIAQRNPCQPGARDRSARSVAIVTWPRNLAS